MFIWKSKEEEKNRLKKHILCIELKKCTFSTNKSVCCIFQLYSI